VLGGDLKACGALLVGMQRCPLKIDTFPGVCIEDGAEDSLFILLVEMDLKDSEGEANFGNVLSKNESETLAREWCKRKDRKVLPVNTLKGMGENRGGYRVLYATNIKKEFHRFCAG
jgi:hypothetical protein